MSARILALLILAACTNPPAITEPTATAQDAFSAPISVAVSEDGPPVQGHQRVLHGPTSCLSANVGQGNPLVWPQTAFPKVGQTVQTHWTLNPSSPFDTTRPALLLVSFERAAVDLTGAGYPGCTMHVPSDPKKLYVLAPDGELVRQVGGIVYLNWVPSGAFAGVRLYCQLVVYSPGANAAEWLLSPGLEILIGTP